MKNAFSQGNVSAYRAPAVARALKILRLLGRSASPMGVSEIARVLGASKGSVHGVLQALREEGAIEEAADKKLRLGPLLDELAARRQGLRTLAEVCQRHLQRLAAETGHTALLGIPERDRLRIEAVGGGGGGLGVGAVPGSRIPLLAGATGKVLMAWGAASIPDVPPRFTAGSPTDGKVLRQEVERVRRDGVALDRGEYLQGVVAVAAPLLGTEDRLMGILYAVGFLDQLEPPNLDSLVEAVRAGARAASRELAVFPPHHVA
jgi:DNA-binding IclR family transcriptional regulator